MIYICVLLVAFYEHVFLIVAGCIFLTYVAPPQLRCDPAPFYLFDEIDQALDANYRAGVARLIQKQVNSTEAPAQFITTTFRPELVAVANRCFGIALQNKNSRIYPLEKVRVCRQGLGEEVS